jgi:hypothetical protein
VRAVKLKGEGILNMRNNNGDIYNSISEIPQAVLPEMHKLGSLFLGLCALSAGALILATL